MKFEEAIVWYKHGHPIRLPPQSKDISRYADYLTFTPTEQQFKVTQHQINSEDWEVKFYGGWIYEFTSKNKVEGNLVNRIKILEEEPTFGVDSNSLLGRVMRLEHIIFTTEDFGPAFEELRNRVVKLETQNKQAKVNKYCWQDIIESPGCID